MDSFVWVVLLVVGSCKLEVAHSTDCPYDQQASELSGRRCNVTRTCSSSRTPPCRSEKKQCVCDGLCGYRCINSDGAGLCPELAAPQHGSVVYTSERSFNSLAVYKCDSGYLLTGDIEELKCQGDGSWSQTSHTPICLPQDEVCPSVNLPSSNKTCYPPCTNRRSCPSWRQKDCLCDGQCGMSCLPTRVPGYCSMPTLGLGTVSESLIPDGPVLNSVLTTTCSDHYEIASGQATIRCLVTREWTAEPLKCVPEAICNDPPYLGETTQRDRRGVIFYPGDTLVYTCRPGYYYYGYRGTSTCRDDLSWTHVALDCQAVSCGDPGTVLNGWREGNIFTFLSYVTFYCNPGYTMEDSPYQFERRTCLSTREWSSFLPECTILSCPPLYAPDDGSMQGNGVTYGESVYYSCHRGYKLTGSGVRSCQSDATWSGQETMCEVIQCPTPDTPANGSKIVPRLGLDAIARFSCNEGYTLVGSQSLRCTEENVWNHPIPACHADCLVPDPPLHSSYTTWNAIPGRFVPSGTQIEIECYDLYSRVDSGELYVCDNGWLPSSAQCVAAPCDKPDQIANANMTYSPPAEGELTTVTHNTRVTYTCLYGYQSQASTRNSGGVCRFGTWQEVSPPNCQPMSCPDEDLPFGQLSYSEGAIVPYHGVSRSAGCAHGYRLLSSESGAAESICQNGRWSHDLPSCEPLPCPTYWPTHGVTQLSGTNGNHGDAFAIRCSQGLKPSVGNGTLYCHAGHWVPDGLECIPNDAAFNVAYGKPSNLGLTGAAPNGLKLIVDGDRITDTRHGSCFRAEAASGDLFWQVNLLQTYRIHNVIIYKKKKYGKWLSDAVVTVGSLGSQLALHQRCGQPLSLEEAKAPSRVSINCSTSVYGQIVSIQFKGVSRFRLCEIEVTATGPFSTCRVPYADNLVVSLTLEGDSLPTNTEIIDGVRVHYRCSAGYAMNGATWNQCKNNVWSNAIPSCTPANCDVSAPQYGSLSYRVSVIQHDQYIGYSCDDNYEKQYENVRCNLGQLTPGPPTCLTRSCLLSASQLGDLLFNSDLQDAVGNLVIPHDSQVVFSCRDGYQLVDGNDSPQCVYGQMKPDVPRCVQANPPGLCSEPTTLRYGTYTIILDKQMAHGTILRYECNQGYVLQDPHDGQVKCNHGVWSRLPTCRQQGTNPTYTSAPCTMPAVAHGLIYHGDKIVAGYPNYPTFNNADILNIRCSNLYALRGSSSITCTAGNWYPAVPTCESTPPPNCPGLGIVDGVVQLVNGVTLLEDWPRSDFQDGVTITARCQAPLTGTLTTGGVRACSNGNWNGYPPKCVQSQTRFRIPGLNTLIYQFLPNATLLIYPGIGELSIECIVPSSLVPYYRTTATRKIYTPQFVNYYEAPTEGHTGEYTCKIFGQQSAGHKLNIQPSHVRNRDVS